MISSNLHFNQLNPVIEPYYSNLEVLKNRQKGPKLLTRMPKRANINSFGFEGAEYLCQ